MHRLLLLILPALALSACGSASSPDEAAVRGVVKTYLQAQANRDAASFCGLLSPELQAAANQGAGCVANMTTAFAQNQADLAHIGDLAVRSVGINGDVAQVEFAPTGQAATLRRDHGTWLVTGLR